MNRAIIEERNDVHSSTLLKSAEMSAAAENGQFSCADWAEGCCLRWRDQSADRVVDPLLNMLQSHVPTSKVVVVEEEKDGATKDKGG